MQSFIKGFHIVVKSGKAEARAPHRGGRGRTGLGGYPTDRALLLLSLLLLCNVDYRATDPNVFFFFISFENKKINKIFCHGGEGKRGNPRCQAVWSGRAAPRHRNFVVLFSTSFVIIFYFTLYGDDIGGK